MLKVTASKRVSQNSNPGSFRRKGVYFSVLLNQNTRPQSCKCFPDLGNVAWWGTNLIFRIREI